MFRCIWVAVEMGLDSRSVCKAHALTQTVMCVYVLVDQLCLSLCGLTPARGPCPGEPPEGGGAGGGLKAPACELLCAGRTPTGPAAWTLCISADAAAHSSILAWRIPCTAEPGGLLSIGPHRVGHD